MCVPGLPQLWHFHSNYVHASWGFHGNYVNQYTLPAQVMWFPQ